MTPKALVRSWPGLLLRSMALKQWGVLPGKARQTFLVWAVPGALLMSEGWVVLAPPLA